MSDSVTPWNVAHPASPSITNSWSLPKLMSIESVMTYNHPVLCQPLLLPPSIFPSIRVFSNETVLHIRWPNIGVSASASFLSMNNPDRFPLGWTGLDLLAVQRTLKSLLQHHSSKAEILRCSSFFIAKLSHPYMTTGETIALTRVTFVDKVMSLLFNKVYFTGFEIAFMIKRYMFSKRRLLKTFKLYILMMKFM